MLSCLINFCFSENKNDIRTVAAFNLSLAEISQNQMLTL